MIGQTVSEAVEQSKELAKTSYAYYKLKIFEQTAYFSSMALQVLLIGGLFLIGILFLAVAGGLVINQQLDSSFLGFIIMGSVLFLVSALIYVMRGSIENFVVRKLSKSYFEE